MQPPPPCLTIDGRVEYEVDRILAHRGKKDRMASHVHRRGSDCSHDTWEPLSHLENCPDKIAEYSGETAISHDHGHTD